MAARLSALRSGRPLPSGIFIVLIPVRGSVDERAVVRLEGLGQLKTSLTSSVLVLVLYCTVLVVQFLNRPTSNNCVQ
jgi:hypothetical protein